MDVCDGKYSEAIIRCRPIQIDGVKLFPICVSDYLTFSECKDGIVAEQQSFPVRYAAEPYLQALYHMDYDCIQANKQPVGYFGKAIRFLALAMRLQKEILDDGELGYPVRILTDQKCPEKLRGAEIRCGDQSIMVTPTAFARLRPILAAQNGLALSDESANAELLEAERDLAAQNAAGLKYDFEDLLYAISCAAQVDPEEIFGWPIRKFMKMQSSIERIYGFFRCAMVEAGGGKYKNGTPFPSWKFDRVSGLSAALMPLSEARLPK